MRIVIAEHAGFCYGVRAAVEKAFSVAAEGPCWTLGSLIHNREVLRRLEEAGVHAVETVDEITGGTVLIRSHGASPAVLEALRAKGLNVIDATCPNVARVHKLVYDYQGTVIIAGAREHPEVVATAGWCRGRVIVVGSAEEALQVSGIQNALLVAQTTLTQAKWEQIVQALRTRIPGLREENTICAATARRQREAETLSLEADTMFVVGGRESANTRALYETCKAHCARVYFLESAADIPKDGLLASDYIAIAAGASTPDWSLKEVATRMNDIEKNVPQEAPAEATAAEPATMAPEQAAEAASADNSNFMAEVEATLVTIRPGQTITGTVVQITDDEVCVNIGYKADGLVKKSDLVTTEVNVGDEIEVEVVKVNDGEGNVVLSQRNIVNRRNWDALMAQYDNGEYVEGTGKEAVKGGLIANVGGVRAFIPASQLSQRYVEKIEDFVGKDLKLKIIEVDKQKKRIVCSRKAVIAEEAAAKKKEVWDKLQEGEVIPGIVRRLTDFGAFVDIGGVDGLVHVTDLSWGRVKHPSEVVTPNQEIMVKVLSLDPERERIQLGYKQTQPRPWDVAEEKYPVGSIVEGKVVRITTFGAFVELEPGLDGLVHISQCALTRIAKVEDAVQVGQIVRVKVLAVDPQAKRISLSIRAALEEEAFNYSDEIPGEEFGTGEEYAPVELPIEE